MKTIIKKLLILLFLTLFLILIFKNNQIVTLSSISALKLWSTKLFPSLFIMFIINDLIINTNTCYYLNKLMAPLLKRVLHLSGESSLAFILSIFSGTPANAYILKELLNNKQISIKDGNKLLMFTFFSNPLFLYNILLLSFNTQTTINIIFISYISNFIISFIVREKLIDYKIQLVKMDKSLLRILEHSIKKSINTMFMILGTVTFFMIFSNIIISTFDLNEVLIIIIKGFLEITQALNELPFLNSPLIIKEIIAVSIISFGGLSIHMQIFSLIESTKLKYKFFLKGRIIHVIIANILLLISFII